jgi:hypothetical protein
MSGNIYMSHKVFFLILVSLIFLAGKSTGRVPEQSEIYLYGFGFFAISMGSLLLIVYLFPKSEAYKNQVEKFAKVKATTGTNSASSEDNFPKTETIPKVRPTERLQTSEHKTVEKPSVSPLPQNQPSNVEIASQNFVFDSVTQDFENQGMQILSKLSGLIDCKSIILYYVKDGVFVAYIEKKGDIYSKYNPSTERADVSDEVIKFLKNKLGAFSSNHTDAVLPLVFNQKLFGAIKFHFNEPKPGINISPIWNEVKGFAKTFYENSKSSSGQTSHYYSLDQFQNILNYRINQQIPQSLSILKITKTSDSTKTLSLLPDAISKAMGKKPEIYKLSEDMLAMFLNSDEKNRLSATLSEVISNAKQSIITLELNLGFADYINDLKVGQQWYDRALIALGESIASGPNQIRTYSQK